MSGLNTDRTMVAKTEYVAQRKGKPLPRMKAHQEMGKEAPTRTSKTTVKAGKVREEKGEHKRVATESKVVINEAAPRVFSAEFVVGATRLDQVPQDDLPHVAFFGRSNVGKSSILAALMGKKGLVKVSAAPGKTREINFFRVNGAFYFVDLPGIGYAKVSIGLRDKMAGMIREYVEHCENLRGIVYLVDIRHAGMPLDVETVSILRKLGKPVLLVANKRDKLNQADAGKALREIRQRFALEESPIAVSALTKAGFDPLWDSLLEALATELI